MSENKAYALAGYVLILGLLFILFCAYLVVRSWQEEEYLTVGLLSISMALPLSAAIYGFLKR